MRYFLAALAALLVVAFPLWAKSALLPAGVDLSDALVMEAEDAEVEGIPFAQEHAGFTGRGMLAGFYQGSVTFDVELAGGPTVVLVRYANAMGQDAIRELDLDGQRIGDIIFPTQPAWTDYATVASQFDLPAGKHKLTLRAAGPDVVPMNLDNFGVMPLADFFSAVKAKGEGIASALASLPRRLAVASALTPEQLGALRQGLVEADSVKEALARLADLDGQARQLVRELGEARAIRYPLPATVEYMLPSSAKLELQVKPDLECRLTWQPPLGGLDPAWLWKSCGVPFGFRLEGYGELERELGAGTSFELERVWYRPEGADFSFGRAQVQLECSPNAPVARLTATGAKLLPGEAFHAWQRAGAGYRYPIDYEGHKLQVIARPTQAGWEIGWFTDAKQAKAFAREGAEASSFGPYPLGQRAEFTSTLWQRTADYNLRELAMAQGLAGELRAAPSGGYNVPFVRDGTNAAAYPVYAGYDKLLARWRPLLMANPSELTWGGKTYRTYGTLVGRPFKYEQDGALYPILAVYTDCLVGSGPPPSEEELAILEDGIRYLREQFYSEELGLLCELYINEAPLKDAPEWSAGERYEALKQDGEWIRRAYTLYLNEFAYGVLLQLAELETLSGRAEQAEGYLAMALELREAIETRLWLPEEGHYLVGWGVNESDKLVSLDWYYWDSFFDYIWALTLTPYQSHPGHAHQGLLAIWDQRKVDMAHTIAGIYFAPSYAHSAYTLNALGDEGQAERLISPLIERTWATDPYPPERRELAMAGAVPETLHSVAFHRPELFTCGPLAYGLSSFGVLADRWGLTLRPQGKLRGFEGFEWKGKARSIQLVEGAPTDVTLYVDGEAIPNCLKSPIAASQASRFELRAEPQTWPVLTYTPAGVRSVEVTRSGLYFHLTSFGPTWVMLAGAAGAECSVTDAQGQKLPIEVYPVGEQLCVDLKAAPRGDFILKVEP